MEEFIREENERIEFRRDKDLDRELQLPFCAVCETAQHTDGETCSKCRERVRSAVFAIAPIGLFEDFVV